MNLAVEAALALGGNPGLGALFRRRPLPAGVADVLRILADPDASAVDADFRLKLEYYVQHVLLHPSAPAHRVLGVNPGASRSEMRANMRLLMLWLHPDAAGADAWRSAFAPRVLSAWREVSSASEAQVASLSETDVAPISATPDEPVGAVDEGSQHASDREGKRRGKLVRHKHAQPQRFEARQAAPQFPRSGRSPAFAARSGSSRFISAGTVGVRPAGRPSRRGQAMLPGSRLGRMALISLFAAACFGATYVFAPKDFYISGAQVIGGLVSW